MNTERVFWDILRVRTTIGRYALKVNLWQSSTDRIVISRRAGISIPTYRPGTTVHVSSSFQVLDDIEDKHQIVLELSDYHEKQFENPWISDYDESMLNAIVGFRFDIDKIEAKQKLSQNKSREDQESAIQALRSMHRENESDIADLMSASLSSRSDL